MFDITRLTLGEIDKVETLSGQSVGSLGEDSTPKGKMMAALAFVVKRRQQMSEGQPPSFTWNEAMDLTLDEANAILGIEVDEAEDEAEEPAPAPRAKKAPKAPQEAEGPTPGES